MGWLRVATADVLNGDLQRISKDKETNFIAANKKFTREVRLTIAFSSRELCLIVDRAQNQVLKASQTSSILRALPKIPLINGKRLG